MAFVLLKNYVRKLAPANGSQALVKPLQSQDHAQAKIILSVSYQFRLVNVYIILVHTLHAWMFPTQLHLVPHKLQTVRLIHHQHNIVFNLVLTVLTLHILPVPVHLL